MTAPPRPQIAFRDERREFTCAKGFRRVGDVVSVGQNRDGAFRYCIESEGVTYSGLTYADLMLEAGQ